MVRGPGARFTDQYCHHQSDHSVPSTLNWSVMTIISITRHGITNVAEFPTYFWEYYIATVSAIILTSYIQIDFIYVYRTVLL